MSVIVDAVSRREPAGWRSSRYSTAAGGAACVQVAPATRRPDGTVALDTGGQSRPGGAATAPAEPTEQDRRDIARFLALREQPSASTAAAWRRAVDLVQRRGPRTAPLIGRARSGDAFADAPHGWQVAMVVAQHLYTNPGDEGGALEIIDRLVAGHPRAGFGRGGSRQDSASPPGWRGGPAPQQSASGSSTAGSASGARGLRQPPSRQASGDSKQAVGRPRRPRDASARVPARGENLRRARAQTWWNEDEFRSLSGQLAVGDESLAELSLRLGGIPTGMPLVAQGLDLNESLVFHASGELGIAPEYLTAIEVRLREEQDGARGDWDAARSAAEIRREFDRLAAEISDGLNLAGDERYTAGGLVRVAHHIGVDISDSAFALRRFLAFDPGGPTGRLRMADLRRMSRSEIAAHASAWHEAEKRQAGEAARRLLESVLPELQSQFGVAPSRFARSQALSAAADAVAEYLLAEEVFWLEPADMPQRVREFALSRAREALPSRRSQPQVSEVTPAQARRAEQLGVRLAASAQPDALGAIVESFGRLRYGDSFLSAADAHNMMGRHRLSPSDVRQVALAFRLRVAIVDADGGVTSEGAGRQPVTIGVTRSGQYLPGLPAGEQRFTAFPPAPSPAVPAVPPAVPSERVRAEPTASAPPRREASAPSAQRAGVQGAAAQGHLGTSATPSRLAAVPETTQPLPTGQGTGAPADVRPPEPPPFQRSTGRHRQSLPLLQQLVGQRGDYYLQLARTATWWNEAQAQRLAGAFRTDLDSLAKFSLRIDHLPTEIFELAERWGSSPELVYFASKKLEVFPDHLAVMATHLRTARTPAEIASLARAFDRRARELSKRLNLGREARYTAGQLIHVAYQARIDLNDGTADLERFLAHQYEEPVGRLRYADFQAMSSKEIAAYVEIWRENERQRARRLAAFMLRRVLVEQYGAHNMEDMRGPSSQVVLEEFTELLLRTGAFLLPVGQMPSNVTRSARGYARRLREAARPENQQPVPSAELNDDDRRARDAFDALLDDGDATAIDVWHRARAMVRTRALPMGVLTGDGGRRLPFSEASHGWQVAAVVAYHLYQNQYDEHGARGIINRLVAGHPRRGTGFGGSPFWDRLRRSNRTPAGNAQQPNTQQPDTQQGNTQQGNTQQPIAGPSTWNSQQFAVPAQAAGQPPAGQAFGQSSHWDAPPSPGLPPYQENAGPWGAPALPPFERSAGRNRASLPLAQRLMNNRGDYFLQLARQRPWWDEAAAAGLSSRLRTSMEALATFSLQINRLPTNIPDLARAWGVAPTLIYRVSRELDVAPEHLSAIRVRLTRAHNEAIGNIESADSRVGELTTYAQNGAVDMSNALGLTEENRLTAANMLILSHHVGVDLSADAGAMMRFLRFNHGEGVGRIPPAVLLAMTPEQIDSLVGAWRLREREKAEAMASNLLSDALARRQSEGEPIPDALLRRGRPHEIIEEVGEYLLRTSTFLRPYASMPSDVLALVERHVQNWRNWSPPQRRRGAAWENGNSQPKAEYQGPQVRDAAQASDAQRQMAASVGVRLTDPYASVLDAILAAAGPLQYRSTVLTPASARDVLSRFNLSADNAEQIAMAFRLTVHFIDAAGATRRVGNGQRVVFVGVTADGRYLAGVPADGQNVTVAMASTGGSMVTGLRAVIESTPADDPDLPALREQLATWTAPAAANSAGIRLDAETNVPWAISTHSDGEYCVNVAVISLPDPVL